MKTELSGKNIIVTGASRGLGLHIARTMWDHGANLILVSRSLDALEQLRNDLAGSALPRQNVHVVATDLRSPNAVLNVMGKARSVWHALYGLVNNAAILGPIGMAWETDWDAWQEAIAVDLIAPIALCRSCVPWMAESGGGKIINLSGGGATGPRENFSAYAVAKTGIARFTEILAREVEELNIQVNSIAPGALNTDMLEAMLRAGPEKVGKDEYDRALRQKENGGISPERAAKLCVFLASSASDGITGKLISAVWDPWEELSEHVKDLMETDIYTLRRIIPKDRDMGWG